ncbi:hypothetical protein [Streptomyces sp. WAC00263]|uniref:hypothetical protein n=1 Tax=Streptomyces sp. WAC00263 TaxID=1917422 RepID=UPI0015EF9576|nr:hypothetical protein [Streptomyces sp. WAC00263]
MTTYQDAVAVEATIAERAWGEAFGRAMRAVAGCFARREARATAAELVAGLLLEVDTRNCWTLAQVLGHRARTGCSTCSRAPGSTMSGPGRRSPAS